MLSQKDLQEFRKIVREEVEVSSGQLRAEFRGEFKEINERFERIDERFISIELRLTKVHQSLKKEMKKLFDFLDRERILTIKRIERLENHLDLSEN